ncbi:MAG: hypothetical protein GC164_14440 [Phycisphaera sp.]|nr:hypothetical protein [Phycisphaera sp.]
MKPTTRRVLTKPRAWLGVLSVATLLTVCATPSFAADDAGDKLSNERWHERGYGLSLRPPLGATLQELTADDAVLRMASPEGYGVKVFIKKSKTDLTMPVIKRTAIDQLRTVYPDAVILSQDDNALAGRKGSTIYFGVVDNKDHKWVVGQALVLVDPRTVVMLQLDTSKELFDKVKPTYEAILASVELEPPQKLDERNGKLIEAGQAWLKSMPDSRIFRADKKERWYRIVLNNKDVGYMKQQSTEQEVMGKKGIRVDVQARIQIGDNAYDSLSNFFVSLDRTSEVWSVKTTTRAVENRKPVNDKSAPPNMSWVETGVRDGKSVSVVRQTPSGRDEAKWDIPDKGYVSAAEVYLIAPLLADAPPGELGYYAYFPATGKISLRTEKIERGGAAPVVVTSEPAPDQGEQVSWYKADGELIKRILPEGRTIEPATPGELKARWGLRD